MKRLLPVALLATLLTSPVLQARDATENNDPDDAIKCAVANGKTYAALFRSLGSYATKLCLKEENGIPPLLSNTDTAKLTISLLLPVAINQDKYGDDNCPINIDDVGEPGNLANAVDGLANTNCNSD